MAAKSRRWATVRRGGLSAVHLSATSWVRLVDLAVDDPGGSALPVVCLPMFGATRAMTAAAFGAAFAGAGLREIYLDLPGHGDSAPEGPADSRTVLAILCSWLERHLGGPALLAGSSYGAYLAAAIGRQRPDLARGLLLVCPGARVGAADRDLPSEEPPTAASTWLDACPPRLRAHLDLALGHRTAAVVATVLQALEAGGPGDEQYQDQLSAGRGYALEDEDANVAFGGPVTVVTGRHDRIVGYADQFRSMRNYPRGSYSVVDAAGHYLPFEQPGLLRALTQDWLHRCGI